MDDKPDGVKSLETFYCIIILFINSLIQNSIVYITNGGLTSIRVFPASGGQINGVGTNIQFVQTVTTTQQYIAISSNQWYTLGTN